MDPLKNSARKIRKKLWNITKVHYGYYGYGKERLTKLVDYVILSLTSFQALKSLSGLNQALNRFGPFSVWDRELQFSGARVVSKRSLLGYNIRYDL